MADVHKGYTLPAWLENDAWGHEMFDTHDQLFDALLPLVNEHIAGAPSMLEVLRVVSRAETPSTEAFKLNLAIIKRLLSDKAPTNDERKDLERISASLLGDLVRIAGMIDSATEK